MSVDIKVVNEKNAYYLGFKGKVTLDDIKFGVKKIYSEEEIYLRKYQIIDFSETTAVDVSSSDVKEVVSMNKEGLRLNSDFKLAIVAPTDLLFGMSRIYKAYGESIGFKISVFRDKENSELWLQRQLNSDNQTK